MKIHELLSDPAKWTKGALAKLADGQTTWFGDPKATCHCLLGAAFICYENDDELARVQTKLTEAIHKKTGLHYSIASYNDRPETTHADILSVCKGY